MTTVQQIFAQEADFFLVDEGAAIVEEVTQPLGVADYGKAVLDGVCSATKPALMTEVAAQLDFPAYFGKNWDALLDSLNEMLWCFEGYDQYLLVFSGADSLLSQEPDSEITNLFEILKASIDALSGDDRQLKLKVVFLLKQVMDNRLEQALTRQGLQYQVLSVS